MREYLKRALFLLWFPVGALCRMLSLWDGVVVTIVLGVAAFVLLGLTRNVATRMKTVLFVSWSISLCLFFLSLWALWFSVVSSDAGNPNWFWESMISVSLLAAVFVNLLIGVALLMRFKKVPIK